MGGLFNRAVSVLTLDTVGSRATLHMPVLLSRHPLITAALVAVIWVLLASYILTCSWSKTVMYPASAILLVLIKEFSLMPGVIWMSLAGALTSYGSVAISVAA